MDLRDDVKLNNASATPLTSLELFGMFIHLLSYLRHVNCRFARHAYRSMICTENRGLGIAMTLEKSITLLVQYMVCVLESVRLMVILVQGH